MPPHSSIIERLLEPSVGDMPADYAQRMLNIDFTDSELARHRELVEKSRAGGGYDRSGTSGVGRTRDGQRLAHHPARQGNAFAQTRFRSMRLNGGIRRTNHPPACWRSL